MRPFFPPRPGLTVYWPTLNSRFDPAVWLAQRKFKGQRNLIHVDKARNVTLWSRHEANDFRHKNYVLSAALRQSILSLQLPDAEIVFDSELLHSKTKAQADNAKLPAEWQKGVRDTIVLFDLLYLDKYLGNWTQMERLESLAKICRFPRQLEPGRRALQATENLWLAENFDANFLVHFKSMLDCPEIEGLVMRRRLSRLRDSNPSQGRLKHDVTWMARVRKPEKNYHH